MTLRQVLKVAVVVGIIVIAVPMCLGFVVISRGHAERMMCQNNLKQMGLATLCYSDCYNRRLPGVHARVVRPENPSDEQFDKQVSWLYEICPFMEARMDNRFFLDPTKPLDSEENRYVVNSTFPWYLCPANATHGPEKNFTNYVGITGVGSDAALLPLSDPRCGFFGIATRFFPKDITDGTSTTLAIVETATANGPWALSGNHTVRGLDINGTDYLGEHGQFNSLHGRSWAFGRPVLTNACFADGSVRSLSSDMSPAVFEALATIAGGEQLPLDW